MANLLITIFLGWLGVHKFIQGKTKMGIIYIFTFGLFGIGWFIDIIIAITHYMNSSQVNKSSNIPTNTRLNYFDVAGTSYRTNDIKKIMAKGNPKYSDFVYRIKEDFVELVPEPTNKHDKNAIAVYMQNVKIGYVPADLTQVIRPLISKCTFIGTIRGGDVRKGNAIIERSFKCEVEINR